MLLKSLAIQIVLLATLALLCGLVFAVVERDTLPAWLYEDVGR